MRSRHQVIEDYFGFLEINFSNWENPCIDPKWPSYYIPKDLNFCYVCSFQLSTVPR